MANAQEHADARRDFLRSIYDVYFCARFHPFSILNASSFPKTADCFALDIVFDRPLKARRKIAIANGVSALVEKHGVVPLVPVIDEFGEPNCFDPYEQPRKARTAERLTISEPSMTQPYSRLHVIFPSHKRSAGYLITRGLTRNALEMGAAELGIERSLQSLLKSVARGMQLPDSGISP